MVRGSCCGVRNIGRVKISRVKSGGVKSGRVKSGRGKSHKAYYRDARTHQTRPIRPTMRPHDDEMIV